MRNGSPCARNPRPDGPLGYLIPEFPQQTHAFFWREIAALEEAGTEVVCFSTRRPPLEACPHPFRDAARARTHYLFPPHASAVAPLLTRPAAATRALRYIAGLRETSARGRARLMALLPSAADLVAACRARGVRHIHVQSCADAAHLAALAHILGGPDYSLALHGDLNVYGTDHAAKMARARFVRAVTPALAAEVARVSPGTGNPMIWMGVDLDRFRPAARARPAGGPLTVVSVARLNFTKGHRFLLRAVAAAVAEGRDIRCRIAGEGPERAAIEAEIAALGLGERVEMLGSLGEAEVLALMQSADALALTSIGEGEAAPVAVMEAMACGLPVVVSVIGGTPDMIADGHDGMLVPQEDVGAIAAALRRLCDDPALRAELGRNARATAAERFDYRQSAARLLAEVERAVA